MDVPVLRAHPNPIADRNQAIPPAELLIGFCFPELLTASCFPRRIRRLIPSKPLTLFLENALG
jgi:hypothetical protein